MKKQKLLNNLKHRLSLLLCLMAFLTVGQGAWANDFYLTGIDSSSESDANKMSNTSTDIYTKTFTIQQNYNYSISVVEKAGDNVTKWGNRSQEYTCNAGDIQLSTGSVDLVYKCVDSGGDVTFTWNNNQHKLTITKSDYPTPSTDTWEIRGFGDWTSGKHVLSEIDGELSCTINLSKDVAYTAGTTDGFKVVKNDGSDHFYGAQNTTITRSNSSAACSASGETSWNFGLSADITGNYKFTLTNVSGNTPELTVTFPASTYAIARWGAAPTIDGSKNINASAYVATHGCNGSTNYEVTQLRVRYWKEGDVANAEVIETEEGTYDPGTAYPITIPYTSNVLINCTTESKIIMEVAAKNDLGWSSYSDRMAVMYTAGTTFVTHNLEKSFTACEGNHQFTLSEMVGPVPGSWAVVTSGGADAKSEFTLADGEMIWNPGDKTTDTYIYTFTFSKEGGYADKSATLTINYTKDAPSGEVHITTPSASEVSATKLQEVALAATKGTGVVKIKWTATPDTYITTTADDGTAAKFQGKAIKPYTVTAVGLSASCGETAASNSVTINVSKDTEDCNE